MLNTTNRLAKRLKRFDSSKIRKAFEVVEEMPNPIDLSIGYPEDDTPDYIKAAGIKAIEENFTRYTATNGIFELRAAVAEKLARENNIETSPDQVTITPGLTTGILLTYLAILDPGDEVLITDPYFPPYRDVAVMLGARPIYIDTYPDFQITAARIKPLISARTKILVINSPNNPSGAIYPEAELVKIARLAKANGLIVISDEIFEYFSYDVPHFSIGSIYPNTLTLNGFSKAYAMTGWRMGYISGPAEIIDAINELQQYTVFASSSISQRAALAALKHSPRKLTTKYRAKRNATKRILGSVVDIQGCQGTFYAFAKLPSGQNDMQLVNLARHNGIIVLPGSAFSKRNDYIRITFAIEKTGLWRGLKILKSLISEKSGTQKSA